MLWGKKVLEWSASPAEAYRMLEHLNNKYALDGRDPNSYSGIFWVLRPLRPAVAARAEDLRQRPLHVSENTARKFDVKPYYAYVERLPTIAEARSGRGA
jgi:deoxyribodipyrimidine photo-lyase